MNLWQYITGPTGASLGPLAMLAIFVSAFVALVGVALIVVPRDIARFISRYLDRTPKVMGLKEHEVRSELRVKVGIVLVVWSLAFILSLLLRLLGTPGLDTRILPSIVIVILPFLIGYIIIYRLFSYPRYLDMSRRIDIQKSYEPTTKKNKGKKTVSSATRREKVDLFPGVALISAGILPLVYYIIMTGISIPPSLPVQSHDHMLHQSGMLIVALVGYLLGLVVSLGKEMRERAAFLKPARK